MEVQSSPCMVESGSDSDEVLLAPTVVNTAQFGSSSSSSNQQAGVLPKPYWDAHLGKVVRALGAGEVEQAATSKGEKGFVVGVFADGGCFETDVPNLSLSPPRPKGTKGKPKAKAKSQGQGKAEAKGQAKAKPSTSKKKINSEAEALGAGEKALEDEGAEEAKQEQQHKDLQKVPRQGRQIKGLDWRFTDVRVSHASIPERSYLVGTVAGEKWWKLIAEGTLQAIQKHRDLADNIKKEIQERNLTKKEAIQLRDQLVAET